MPAPRHTRPCRAGPPWVYLSCPTCRAHSSGSRIRPTQRGLQRRRVLHARWRNPDRGRRPARTQTAPGSERSPPGAGARTTPAPCPSAACRASPCRRAIRHPRRQSLSVAHRQCDGQGSPRRSRRRRPSGSPPDAHRPAWQTRPRAPSAYRSAPGHPGRRPAPAAWRPRR